MTDDLAVDLGDEERTVGSAPATPCSTRPAVHASEPRLVSSEAAMSATSSDARDGSS